MQKDKLYDIRDKLLEFGNLLLFKNKLKSFFGENFEIPLIIGDKSFSKDYWKIITLSLSEKADELTILNFYEGLAKVTEETKQKNSFEFRGSINYQGINSPKYSSSGENIFWAMVSFKQSEIPSAQYYLNINLLHEERGLRYTANTNKFETEYDEIMQRFLGPNKK